MTTDSFGAVRCLGGPVTDVYDVLHACFDATMRQDCGSSAVCYVERFGSEQSVHRFPEGAFRTADEVA